MNLLNPFRFDDAVLLPPNTFLGGVSASITSPTDYAAATGCLVEYISNFVISGSDVSFHVDNNYGINNASFPANPGTWVLDVDGRVVGNLGIANNKDSLKYIFTPNATGVSGQFTLDGCLVLSKVNVQSVATIGSRYFISRTNALKKIYLPNLTQITNTGSQGVLNSLGGLERLYIPSLTTFSGTEENRFLEYNPGRFPTFYNTKTNCKVFFNSALGVDDRRAWNRITLSTVFVGDKFTINGLLYTCVSTVTTDGEFTASATSFASAINSDTRTGIYSDVSAINDGSFIGLQITAIGVAGNAVTLSKDGLNTGTSTIYSPTFVGGNDIHKALMYLRDERSCIMTQVGTPIPVDAPTGLSYSNQTSDTVDLNFTAPTPNANGIDAYEVWVDDGTVYRKLFEYAEISASGDTLNLAEVISDVGSISGIKIKIRTIDGQMNFSDFSNEITLP